ncbi:MAG: YqgE/AlgH family protein [Candidatus Tectomicrobia bacterium]|nr:YqgE/AlgH family protein [Candidatus Tectomicrobia bacterium]
MGRRGRSLILAAALLLSASSLHARLPGGAPQAPPAAPFHQGEFLVAAPGMGDPRFREAVILLIHHDAKGAFGLIINKPLGEMPLNELLRRFQVGGKAEGEEKVRIHYGGPVQPELGFVLHTSGEGLPPQKPLAPGYGMSPFADVLRAMAQGKRPKRGLFILGYAGWGPGQLEGEMGRGAWETAPADEDILFDPDHAAKWERAMERRTRTL